MMKKPILKNAKEKFKQAATLGVILTLTVLSMQAVRVVGAVATAYSEGALNFKEKTSYSQPVSNENQKSHLTVYVSNQFNRHYVHETDNELWS